MKFIGKIIIVVTFLLTLQSQPIEKTSLTNSVTQTTTLSDLPFEH
jgi:hypothetical protein